MRMRLIILIAMLALCLGACGGEGDPDSTPALGSGPTEASGTDEDRSTEAGATPTTAAETGDGDRGDTDAGVVTTLSKQSPRATADTVGVADTGGGEMKTEFAPVSAGDTHTCGLRGDGTIVCWGDNEFGQSMPPEGEFASVSLGTGHTCGLKVDGTVSCWGEDGHGESTPPEGRFASISAGLDHNCGLRTG